MPITQPTIDDFQDTTVMRVIRKVVNYLVTLIPKVNEEIANVTDSAGERLDTVEANVEALNKELPTEIRVDYDASTGNFNIDYVKEDGDVLTSNTVVIVSGSTGEVTIVQNTSGISINGITLQSATTAQPGLMTPALVSSLNNVNDTTNDHTTMLNAQAEAITELDGRVDALEQGGGGGGSSGISTNPYDYAWTDVTPSDWGNVGYSGILTANADYDVLCITSTAGSIQDPAGTTQHCLFEIVDLQPFKDARDANGKYSKVVTVIDRASYNQYITIVNLFYDSEISIGYMVASYNIAGSGGANKGFPQIKFVNGTGSLVSYGAIKIWGGKKNA